MRGSKTYTSSSAADPKKRGRGNPQEGSTYVCADMGKGIRKQGANGRGVGVWWGTETKLLQSIEEQKEKRIKEA